MSPSPFRWAIAGFGWVARDYAAPAMLACGHRVAAVADPDPRARPPAALLGADLFEDADALLARVRPDALYVATPNHLHRGPVEAALRAGVPVLCEKPAAATLPEAEAILDRAAETGTRLRIAFEQRHHPAHRAIAAALADGAIGTATAIRIVYACWVGPAFAPVAGHDNWRVDPARAGGGAAIDLAPHGLDLAAFLLGERIEQLSCTFQRRVHPYPVDDGAMLTGRSAGGVLVSLHVAYNHPEFLPRRRLEIVGTGGMIVATDTMGLDPGGAVRVLGSDGAARALPYGDPALSPFEAQMRDFADAVRAGGPPPPLDDDRHAARLLAHALGDAVPCR